MIETKLLDKHHDKKPTTTNKFSSSTVDFCAGAVGGIAGKLIEYPMDVVKTRAQSGFFGDKSTLTLIKDIVRHEPLSFYRGVSVPMFGCALECAVAFWAFNKTIDFIMENHKSLPSFSTGGDSSSASLSRANGDHNRYSVVAVAGAMSGLANTLLLTPIEVAKCRIQANPKKYKNVRETIRISIQEEGWRVFGTGFGGTMAREVPGSIGFFIALEWSMNTFFSQYRYSLKDKEKEQTEQTDEQKQIQKQQDDDDDQIQVGELKPDTPAWVRPICGGFAGLGLINIGVFRG